MEGHINEHHRDLNASRDVRGIEPSGKEESLRRAGGQKDPDLLVCGAHPMSVQLVGDFTHWQQPPIQLRKGADGLWRTSVELPPGTYHYRFLVDGQWRDDPECALQVPIPYGGRNAVRQVA